MWYLAVNSAYLLSSKRLSETLKPIKDYINKKAFNSAFDFSTINFQSIADCRYLILCHLKKRKNRFVYKQSFKSWLNKNIHWKQYLVVGYYFSISGIFLNYVSSLYVVKKCKKHQARAAIKLKLHNEAKTFSTPCKNRPRRMMRHTIIPN